jgi:hypothetical protein
LARHAGELASEAAEALERLLDEIAATAPTDDEVERLVSASHQRSNAGLRAKLVAELRETGGFWPVAETLRAAVKDRQQRYSEIFQLASEVGAAGEMGPAAKERLDDLVSSAGLEAIPEIQRLTEEELKDKVQRLIQEARSDSEHALWELLDDLCMDAFWQYDKPYGRRLSDVLNELGIECGPAGAHALWWFGMIMWVLIVVGVVGAGAAMGK